MISLQIMKEEGIVIIEPSSPLEHPDFEKLTKEIDEYIEEKGGVNGLIIHTKSFPGWENFAAFTGHMKFVKDHHHKIKRIAAVTDSKFLSILPSIAKHFVAAEIKHFDYEEMETAKQWIQKAV
jgi:hypothetical protein